TLLDPIYELPDYYEGMPESEKELLMQREEERKERAKIDKHMRETAEKLDPDPTRRQLVERQLVIDSIKKRGRLTKAELLARTERQSRFWSIELRTSPKKLTKLMNQIQGKTVEEALVQMRFSKKRAARDVIKGLMEARDTAIVARGMGLGRDEATARQDKTREAILKARAERLLSPGTYLRPKTGEPTIIELKDGSRKKVYDPTDIYVDRAWIGRGAHIRKSALPRARGQINVLHHRTSHFGVVLKEEKTRMRVSDEIKKKRDNRKLWTALPDRVVTAQRQFCLW
ncbi:ribosomal protein L22, partial [Sporormia fimetaria CBS 119925]